MNPLAVSNLAWTGEEEADALSILGRYGFSGVEIAPTVLFPDWKDVTVENGKTTRNRFEGKGFQVCALQSILFGHPEFQVFRENTHDAFLRHMEQVADFAEALGAKVLVFGSPKNRKRGQLSPGQAVEKAIPFLRKMGDCCAERGCILGWEANPAEYACDFVTNLAEAIELVKAVDHPGVQVHGDAGGMHLCGEPLPVDRFTEADFCHFHVSEPMLDPVGTHGVGHEDFFKNLTAVGYQGWISIEMKRAPNGLAGLESSVHYVKSLLKS